jgi:hypothetical protein
MSGKYSLPSKIVPYLRRLAVEYERAGQQTYLEIIRSAHIFIREEPEYDNWDGGIYGHDVILFLSPEVLGKIELENQDEHRQNIYEKLGICAQSVKGEFFSGVYFEYEDEDDPEYQQAITIDARPQINPDTLSIWKPGHIRLFISHRDSHKAAARALADALEEYGISAFVAHDTIKPMSTWQEEIIKGLETMEIMLAFVTDDFHDSTWTNQEIGFSLGRNIPVVSLKLQRTDPSGFIGNQQALKGKMETPEASVARIYELLSVRLGNQNRMQRGLVTAFVESPDFNETKRRFDRMTSVIKKLSDEEVSEIIDGFRSNDQLHNAIYLNNQYHRLRNFLNRTTGQDYAIDGKTVSPLKQEVDDEIPF